MRRLLAVLFTFLVCSPVYAATVLFLPNPRFKIDDHLVYLLTKIPLAQMRAEQDSHIIHVHGELTFDLSELPEILKEPLKDKLEKLIAGEVLVSGAKIDASQAFISYKLLSAKESLVDNVTKFLEGSLASRKEPLIIAWDEYAPDPALKAAMFETISKILDGGGTHFKSDTFITTLNPTEGGVTIPEPMLERIAKPSLFFPPENCILLLSSNIENPEDKEE